MNSITFPILGKIIKIGELEILITNSIPIILPKTTKKDL